MAESNSDFGSVVYIEFRDKNLASTYQAIFVPEFYHPDTQETHSSSYVYRNITEQNPRRAWRQKFVEMEKGTKLAHDELKTDKELVLYLNEQLKPFETFISALVSHNWELYRTPVVVDMSAQDLRDLSDRARPPAALIRRIYRARVDAGFEDDLIVSPS